MNKGQLNFYSLDKEVALGRRLSAEVDREGKFIDDPIIVEYVNRVGQNLVLHSDSKVPFTIKVLDADETADEPAPKAVRRKAKEVAE